MEEISGLTLFTAVAMFILGWLIGGTFMKVSKIEKHLKEIKEKLGGE